MLSSENFEKHEKAEMSGRIAIFPDRVQFVPVFHSSVMQSDTDSLLNAGAVDFKCLKLSSCVVQSMISLGHAHDPSGHTFVTCWQYGRCIVFRCSLPFLSGPLGSSSLTSAYAPSFLKKEVGSAGQRVQLAPVVDPSSGKSCTKVLLVPWSALQ